ncbi:acetylornithine deacetylase/succinyl-diaminopimelate desuccinylase-like protein [Azospirillum lipoferum]|uniref:M20 family metallopeptidase n=1 Tax=Azospirillum lipoferum TaxID=193 RepID=A0A5A9GL37_AZOLI|nr:MULTISPECIES: M20 family metallopeptidase [Azospirillum]KAA0594462.1 M20 family metallopeptidase [Azospirillum lipoferum]MCP1613211.1 acetylornithine deacetylase/succinyl-diaminopimelate desuccinylase-like protein [Azospirillum lipoferum]MDW5531410.1 M20 family metallopeptidase [Azospirillum sp. NL1]
MERFAAGSQTAGIDDDGRGNVLAETADHLQSGAFVADLDRRMAHRTDSTAGDPGVLHAYLADEIAPTLLAMGFTTEICRAAEDGRNLFLIAERHEDSSLPTVLMYGHGDVVAGMEDRWSDGLSPWRATVRGDRLYGRGSADNKGQHSINLAAFAAVLKARQGRVGFNLKLLLEMGEEIGSPELQAICRSRRDRLKADVMISSDGPRIAADRPTLFLGARGGLNIRLTLDLRPGGHHSGNWGGLLVNPATRLSAAIACLVDGQGRILVDGLRPPPLSDAVRRALSGIPVVSGPGEPEIDADWGEPGLSPAERVYGWNTLEVLAMSAGNTQRPVNAIPGKAEAVLQLRFVVGTDAVGAGEAVKAHLAANGFGDMEVSAAVMSNATRLDLDDDWVRWAVGSMERTTAKPVALLPNFGGSLPNEFFVEDLGLPTLWVPHSYPGCNQHAPDEHLLLPVADEALRIMAGLFWDLGERAAR